MKGECMRSEGAVKRSVCCDTTIAIPPIEPQLKRIDALFQIFPPKILGLCGLLRYFTCETPF